MKLVKYLFLFQKTMTSVEQFKDSIEQRLRQIEKMGNYILHVPAFTVVNVHFIA